MKGMSSVGKEIHRQMGGPVFTAVTGCTVVAHTRTTIRYRIPDTFPMRLRGVREVEVRYDQDDSFTVTFAGERGGRVAEHSDVCGDDLQRLFTRETGLATTMM